MHPTYQNTLRNEIRAQLPSPSSSFDPTNSPTAADIDALPFLTAVCNETLRLYPTVPVTIREAIRPTTIPCKDPSDPEATFIQLVPHGARVLISPWAVNRSPHIWGADAGEFQPERWLSKGAGAQMGDSSLGLGGAIDGIPSSNYAFLTFLHGARSCIGQGFARAELKTLAAAMVGRFEIALADGVREVEPAGVITTKPKGGMRLRLKVIEGW